MLRVPLNSKKKKNPAACINLETWVLIFYIDWWMIWKTFTNTSNFSISNNLCEKSVLLTVPIIFDENLNVTLVSCIPILLLTLIYQIVNLITLTIISDTTIMYIDPCYSNIILKGKQNHITLTAPCENSEIVFLPLQKWKTLF